MSTFSKEISWVTSEYDATADEGKGAVVEIVKTKEVLFRELNRQDKTQHKLHFKIISMFEGTNKDSEGEVSFSSDALYDITVKAINQLIIIDDNFKETDKKELLNDSFALLNLGMFLFGEKFAPFFQKLKMN